MSINKSGSCSCDICGSNIGGYICRCGEMRCICEREPCQTCEQQKEFEEEQARYDAEKRERANFENRMDEKYH